MKKVITTTILRISFDPNTESIDDIESRIKEQISSLIRDGHLEGCEHGAQIDSSSLEVSVSGIE